MKLDTLRRHAAISTATGLALATLASCGTAARTGPASSATIPADAVQLPLAQRVSAGLARIRHTSDNPPGDQWTHYKDASGTIWYFWPLPDGRYCFGKEFRLGDQDIREVGCSSDPLPDDGGPAVKALHGPASTDHGGWVSFLYADQEEVQDVSCGDARLTATRIGTFPGPLGPRVLYAVPTPWAVLGVLHARVRHADGTIAPDQVKFPDGNGSAHVSSERVCT
ncbi:hypothetical protein ACFQ6N_13970 [Kitasatospora sp. NPDC056446]|uniref:hypothetical protein n=1 Tax=Kitasatospora sp. NPDC056446 TaxID=3345819 RepID=UPI003683A2D0